MPEGGDGEVQYIRGITVLNTYIWEGRGVAVCWEVHAVVHIYKERTREL